VSGTSVDQNNA